MSDRLDAAPVRPAYPRRRIVSRTFLALCCLAMLSGLVVLGVGWVTDLPTSYGLGVPLVLGGLAGFFVWDVFFGPFLKRLRRLT